MFAEQKIGNKWIGTHLHEDKCRESYLLLPRSRLCAVSAVWSQCGLVVYPSAPKEGEMSRLPSAGGIIAHRGPGEHRRGEDAHLILTSVLQFATY